MSVTENGNGMVMPVGPMGGYGDAGFGGGLFWLLVIFVIAMAGGNGFSFGGFGGGNMQTGFDQQATMMGINNLSSAMSSLAQGQCSGFANVTGAINNGFLSAEVAANARQIADMQQMFNAQTAVDARLDSLAMALQNCCCENRAAVADLKNTVTMESAATRQAILDKLCQQEIDTLKTANADLRNQLNIASFDASQNAQNNYLQNALTAQTQYFLSLYPPTAAAAKASSSTT